VVVWSCVFRALRVCLVMVGVVWRCVGGRVRLVLVWVWLTRCCLIVAWLLWMVVAWLLTVVLVLVLRLLPFCPRLRLRCLYLWCLVRPHPRVRLCPRVFLRVLGVLVWGLVLVCVIGALVWVLVAGWCLVVVWLLVGGGAGVGVCVLWFLVLARRGWCWLAWLVWWCW